MLDLPDPINAVIRLLKFFGAPALVLTPVAFVAWLLSWFDALRLARDGAAMVGRAGRRRLDPMFGSIAFHRVLSVVGASVVVAATYGIARLRIALERSHLSSESHGSAQQIFEILTTYSNNDRQAVDAAWIAVGWTGGTFLAAAISRDRVVDILSGVLGIAAVPVGGIGGLAVVSFLFTLTQDSIPEKVVTAVVATLGCAFAGGTFVFLKNYAWVPKNAGASSQEP